MGKYKQLLLLPQKNGELDKVGKLAFCRNTTIHFLNFEIYKRSLYHEGRALCKQVINHGSRTVFPYYIMTMPNKEDASSYLSSSDVWQLCMLSVVSCHQYLQLFKSSFFKVVFFQINKYAVEVIPHVKSYNQRQPLSMQPIVNNNHCL